MTKDELLENWQKEQIKKVEDNGGEMFLGVPDKWYQKPTWADINGHISNMYLKSSTLGPICLECHEPIYIVPPETTEEDLKIILNL